MTLPVAVSPATRTPGFFLLLDVLGGSASPSTAARRILIIAPKSSAGTGVVGTLYENVGADDVKARCGTGTPGHLAAKRIFARNARARVDLIIPSDGSGGGATDGATFATVPTANYNVQWTVHGVVINVPWLTGESVATFTARAVSTLNGNTDNIAVTFVDTGAGVITANAKIPGPWGNSATG